MRFQTLPTLLFRQTLKQAFCFACFLMLSHSTIAQRVTVKDMLTYLSSSPEKLDNYMLRNGFICYRSEGGLTNWTCIFAYANNSLMPVPEKASGLIQYVRTCRSNIVTYQMHSKEQCDQLQKELIELGYKQLDPTASEPTFAYKNTIVTCQKVATTNGISGNYTGYALTMSRRLY